VAKNLLILKSTDRRKASSLHNKDNIYYNAHIHSTTLPPRILVGHFHVPTNQNIGGDTSQASPAGLTPMHHLFSHLTLYADAIIKPTSRRKRHNVL